MRGSTRLKVLALVLPAVARAPSARAEEAPAAWQATLGGGVLARPTFPGSAGAVVWPLPYFDVSYGGRWFARSDDGVGANLLRDTNWRVSLSVAPDLTRRREHDDLRLTGLGDVSATAEILGRVVYSSTCAQGAVSVWSDIAGQGHGTSVDASFAIKQTQRTLSMREGLGLTWESREFLQTFFGVTEAQAQRSGLPLYSPAAGLSAARAYLQASYQVTPRWSFITTAQLSYWLGRAADSPITERKAFGTYGLFLTYTL